MSRAEKNVLYPVAPALPAVTTRGHRGAAGRRRGRPSVGMQVAAGAGGRGGAGNGKKEKRELALDPDRTSQ